MLDGGSNPTVSGNILYFQSDIWLEVSMCGHFSQSMTRENCRALLADEPERDTSYNPDPIG